VQSEPEARRSRRIILVAFVAVIGCFLAATAVTLEHTRTIDADAQSIASDAMPSVEHLAAARTELRHLAAVLQEYVAGPATGHRPDIDAVLAPRFRLEREAAQYLALPLYPHEADLWADVSAALTRVDEETTRVIAAAERHEIEKAEALLHESFRPAAEAAGAALEKSIDFNAKLAHDLALEIRRTRTRAALLAIALDGVSVGLALIAAALAVRQVTKYVRLITSHGRLLEVRARELEHFASRVAHDILSPLATAELSMALVAREAALGGQVKEIVERGRRSLQRTRRIIDGLYEFARSGAKPPPGARAEVADVLIDLEPELRRSADEAAIALEIEPYPADVAVACNPGVLTSMVSNLVSNAVKYMRESPVRHIAVRIGSPAPDRVRISVEDTGPGVPEALRPLLFEPYVRAPGSHEPGIGLGLATVKRLALAHGGAVGAEARPGGGSIFWFELPRAAPGAPRPPSPGGAPKPAAEPPAAASGPAPHASLAPAAGPPSLPAPLPAPSFAFEGPRAGADPGRSPSPGP
jgi:signal transduction histidine kinase